MKMRQDIQFLRGFAVLAVLFFHLQIPFFENGFLGVDVFFVISGFLMAKLYNKGTFLDFYKRRLDRLYPAYIFTLLATLMLGALITIPVDFNQLTDQVLAGLFFISNFFYWSQNSYFDKAAFNPLLNLWSLAVELQFYLIVPFLFPFIRRRRSNFAIVFFGSLVACWVIQLVSPKTAFFLMPFRVWEFLIGAWVAWCGTSQSPDFVNKSRVSSLIYIFALMVSLFLLKLKPDATGTVIYGHPALPAFIVTLLTGFVIRYGIATCVLDSAIAKFVVKMGDYSYSIYLVHFPIIVLLNYVPFGGTRLVFDEKFRLLMAVAIISLSSVTSYFYVEKRWAAIFNLNKSRILSFGLVLLLAFPLTVFNRSQYSVPQINVFSAWTDRDTYRCGKIFRVIHPVDRICALDEVSGNRNVLLIGNSHADSIKKVFASKAASYGISTYFVVANDPLIGSGPTAEQLVAESLKCDIEAIVLHYSDIYKNSKSKDEVVKLINLARKEGIKLVLIAPVPTYSVHIPKAMFEGIEVRHAFQITRTQHLEKTKPFQDFSANVKKLGVEIYDPSEWLCGSDGICFYAANDCKPYYFDSNHLTLLGASQLNPLFDRVLKNL